MALPQLAPWNPAHVWTVAIRQDVICREIVAFASIEGEKRVDQGTETRLLTAESAHVGDLEIIAQAIQPQMSTCALGVSSWVGVNIAVADLVITATSVTGLEPPFIELPPRTGLGAGGSVLVILCHLCNGPQQGE